jgi:hypothetical protein
MKLNVIMIGALSLFLGGYAHAGPSEKELSPYVLGISENVNVLFEHFDLDKDGVINRAEAAAYFEHIQAVRIKD